MWVTDPALQRVALEASAYTPSLMCIRYELVQVAVRWLSLCVVLIVDQLQWQLGVSPGGSEMAHLVCSADSGSPTVAARS